jgi:hypothetical protein
VRCNHSLLLKTNEQKKTGIDVEGMHSCLRPKTVSVLCVHLCSFLFVRVLLWAFSVDFDFFFFITVHSFVVAVYGIICFFGRLFTHLRNACVSDR